MPPRRRPGSDNVQLISMAAAPSSSNPEEAQEATDQSRAHTPTSPRDDAMKFPAGETTEIERRVTGPPEAAAHNEAVVQYRVYKRRFFGLAQFILLNIIISWDWLSFAAVSKTSSEYFRVSENTINWLSTAFLFAFVVVTPIVILALHRGPKDSLMIAAVLTLIGNWIRYAGAKANGGVFGVVMFGQILVGFAQPFVLAAPTRYSDLWFSDRGRVSATAVATLANPFGGALGQLISPMWAENPEDVPNMVLYVAIIATVICVPSFFVPATPPTPPSASSALPKLSIRKSLADLRGNASFYLLFVPFTVYLSLFNALSSLLNQILYPYGYTEDQAGICGAVLIVVGLVCAAATSPIIDRTHSFLFPIKVLVPLVAVSYLAFTWMPQTRTIPGPYVVAAVLGGSSFSLVPIVLEYLVEIAWPASPEVSSTICWAGGQLFGGIFILIMGSLKEKDGSPGHTVEAGDRPPNNMYRALVFQTVLACIAMPVPMFLGLKRLGLGSEKAKSRYSMDRRRA